ncbi:UNVERIFIED_CONTAM: hypothetical protein Slati_2920100 [Sesamum latifolium]|uniref:RNase H type-1 domain-containing protein n=1 Tax=Sesamum latifolium TaxID=2727402 RepID=A0AAW2VE01_9LAMI
MSRFGGNLRSTKAILDMEAPININEVQRLTFISKSIEKSLPFFKTLRKAKNFEWDTNCQQAFEGTKEYLARLPLLVEPSLRDTLYLYLSSTPQAISFVLVREEGGGQSPIYHISKVLNGAEGRYPPIEKMALPLVITVRRLRSYFLSYPIGDRTLEKGRWLLHADGSATRQGGAGIVITSPHVEDMEFAGRFELKPLNKEAEYESLVSGMRMARDAGAWHLTAYSNSQLIVKQVKGEYEVKQESMIQYLQQVEDLKVKFESFQHVQIRRGR